MLYTIRYERTGDMVTRAVYTVLGIYMGESEGANYWLGVLNDLKNRGIEDILIVSVDGLKGFKEAINAVFSQTEVQLCIIHQVRNSLMYIASKDKKKSE